jgi:hypothetical protein
MKKLLAFVFCVVAVAVFVKVYSGYVYNERLTEYLKRSDPGQRTFDAGFKVLSSSGDLVRMETSEPVVANVWNPFHGWERLYFSHFLVSMDDYNRLVRDGKQNWASWRYDKAEMNDQAQIVLVDLRPKE